jgi:inorganic pyrophosphatase
MLEMADFNKILTPGDVDKGIVNAVIEIPTGSINKVEWDREKAVFKVDRIEAAIFAKPINYGFIPQTIDEDGDELDALIYTDSPLPMGVYLECSVIGILRFEDDGEVDDKIVVVPVNDSCTGNHIQSLTDIPQHKLHQIAHHFDHYKDLQKPDSTHVKHWGDATEAITVIRESIERWNQK